MTNIISLLIIFIFAVFFSFIFKKKIEETTIFSIFLIILILYVGGLFSFLNISYYLICLSSLIFLLILISNHKKINYKLILTPGLIFLILTTIVSIIIHHHRFVVTFDEFNHWFLATKDMYLNNELFTSIKSTVLAKNNTPGSTIFHYFWMKPSPIFDESLVFISMNFLLFSLLAPIFSIYKSNQWKHSLFIGFFLFLIPLTIYNYIYTGAYVDGLMGLIFAHILYLRFIKKYDKFNLLSIILALFIFPLIKTTAIIFTVASVILIFIDILFFNNQND